jgi:hypothetical protein
MPGGSDAVAQHEADYQQRYKVGHLDSYLCSLPEAANQGGLS